MEADVLPAEGHRVPKKTDFLSAGGKFVRFPLWGSPRRAKMGDQIRSTPSLTGFPMADSNTTQIQRWLDLLQTGDEAARDALVRHSCDRLTRLTRKMLRGYPRLRRWEETDDVLQNALLPIWAAASLVLVGLLIAVASGYSKWFAPSGTVERANVAPFVPVETPTGSTVDLLPLIEPEKDTTKGKWKITNGVLHSDADEISHIKIPYEVPDEYSLTVVAVRRTLLEHGRGTFGLGLVPPGGEQTFRLAG